jgi:NADPH-dependent glutamate synthase beta subunit-like oxidoreductase
LGQKVRDYVGLLDMGEVKEALLTIRKDNPLPGLCAYVCHHPCEDACVRGSWDAPVSIRELKRYAIHYEMAHREEILEVLKGQRAASNGKEVAVIGAGPAGLACAYSLLMGGCGVKILDAMERPGGMLLGGIPSFRLPRRVIEHDVGMIQSLGAIFSLGLRVGEDIPLEEVRKSVDGVVVATGAWKDLGLGVPGEGARGTEPCLSFLGRINKGEKEIVSGKVVVIGGGNAAMDTARSALRVGAEEVILAYRRTREEMPANPEEIDAAIREGVTLQYLTSPKRIIVSEGGAVKGLEVIKMTLTTPDESGRKRPVPVEGSEFVLEADWILPAVGQRPDAGFIEESALSTRGTISCKGSGHVKGYEGVFAAGDAVNGPSTVVEAAASGKRAALQALQYLQG